MGLDNIQRPEIPQARLIFCQEIRILDMQNPYVIYPLVDVGFPAAFSERLGL